MMREFLTHTHVGEQRCNQSAAHCLFVAIEHSSVLRECHVSSEVARWCPRFVLPIAPRPKVVHFHVGERAKAAGRYLWRQRRGNDSCR